MFSWMDALNKNYILLNVAHSLLQLFRSVLSHVSPVKSNGSPDTLANHPRRIFSMCFSHNQKVQ